MRINKQSVVLFLAISLSACGGGGGSHDSTAPDTPSSINTSSNTDGTMVITGKAETNSTIKVVFPDGTHTKVRVNNNGEFTITSNAPQPSGNVIITSTDKSGNTSTPTTESFIDETAPNTPVVNSVTQNNNGSITFVGVAEPNSIVAVKFPDGKTKKITTGSDGSYSITSEPFQNTGDIEITSSDAENNISGGYTQTYTDNKKPETPSDVMLSVDNNGVISITGKAEPKSTVTAIFITSNTSAQTVTVAANKDGKFLLVGTPTQQTGSVHISSSDSAGSSNAEVINFDTGSSAPITPTLINTTSNSDGSVFITGKADANTTITITLSNGTQETTNTDANGNFTLITPPLQPSGSINITSTDASNSTSNPASILIVASHETIKAIYLATGEMPDLGFKPSLGINTEAPQGGADTAGMPMPFVDIFRTARPFKESQRIQKTDANGNVIRDANNQIVYTQNSTTYDNNGWPTSIDPTKFSVSTLLLQGVLKNSIPDGKYTVLYDGNGRLAISNKTDSPTATTSVLSAIKSPNENVITLDLSLSDFNTNSTNTERKNEQIISSTNQIYAYVDGISKSKYIKNIRIVMPGGTCSGNPFIRVDETDTCPNGSTYESFVDRLKADRNAIIFNPDYLMFLRNFKVIRMMNLMEASLKKLCYTSDDCPAGVGTWDHRAKLDDAVWGGNDGRTSDEDHKGVPIEVMVELANTLKKDIWVNMPHISDDGYITNYAKYLKDNLDSSLKVYLEYSNEVWNNGFAGHAYAVSKGTKRGLNTVPRDFVGYRDANYFARLRFYSKRAVEIFDLWEAKIGAGNSRLVRVLGSFIGDKVLTDQMLKTIPTDKVDAIAIAPYFFGCPYQDICTNAPNTLLSATTVNDIFAALDQPANIDVKSIDGTIEAVKKQLSITHQYNVDLISYEGGQHLVTGVLGNKATTDDQIRLRKLFNDANRDSRMKQRYLTFLNAWKDLSNEGTGLFTLYTLPQSFYRHGNFGIKEHLNKSRAESPKFDGVMSFQESVGNCWWDEADCTP